MEEQNAKTQPEEDSTEHYRALIDLAPDVIYSIAADGTLVSLSPAFKRITGWEIGDWVGRKFIDLVHPEDFPIGFDAFQRGLRGETVPAHEMRVRTKAGGCVVGEFSSRPRFERGRVVGTIGVARDITERKQAEEELARLLDREQEARAQAEVAVRLREDFLSMASHELRTPLTTLKLQMHLLRESMSQSGFPVSDPGRALVRIDAVDRQLERLSRLVTHLLDVSRIASGHIELEPSEVDLGALTREVVERFTEERTSDCAIQVRTTMPVIGWWDWFRIDQVVTNLVANALKYGEGGQVVVSVDQNDTQAVLTVQDRGIGIQAEDLSRIFERFERLPSTTRYVGFGLGLYIVRQIIEAHGGAIDVESEPGIGSTFRVSLPLGSASRAGASQPPVLHNRDTVSP